jgi:hypothetical protein
VRRTTGAAALIAAVATASSVAQAEDGAALARAQKDFQQALADEQAGAWEKALAELTEAGELAHKETPQLLYHLGLCHAKLGKLVLAREELSKAAERARADGLGNVATTSKAQLAELQPRIASLALTKPAHGEVTTVTVDGVDTTAKVGTAVDLDPGVHQVHVTYAEGPPVDMSQTLADGEHRALPIPEPATSSVPPPVTPPVIAPPPAAEPPPAPTASPPSSPSQGGSGRTVGWILIGGGAALGAVGGVFWALRGGAISTLTADCGASGDACPASDQSVINRGKLDDALGVTFWTVGGAALLTGTALVIFGGSRSAEATAVRVGPLVVAGGGGLSIAGTLR